MSKVLSFSKSLLAAASSKVRAAPASSAAASAEPTKGSGITKMVPVSPAFRKFVGVAEISRAQAVKKIWDHIKLHSLQNPENRREIILDDKLKSIFGNKDKIGMMEISKLLSPHFIKSS
ncbi:upstream activation factor subunit UAF30-like isoform X2 [Carex littledalei]|uniref:Upstream activation factor subunit UAF30-like isoform X2 n=1 Tax=Carex littledalei TaxID=544730 RepID=A0A833QSA5_9POAL|nr:upstream activation factor subunit UAF30-like isoform X2 [Carex littledalei]